MISALIEQRKTASETVGSLADLAVTEKRKLTEDEQGRFDAAETEKRELDTRIAELDAQVRADDAASEVEKRYAPAKAGEGVRNEPAIYRSGPGGNSYFRDLHLARNKGNREATDRLARNDQGRAFELRTGTPLSTVNGTGGEFVPPLWLEEQFVKLARPGRITANLINNQPLPAGTDSINIPKVATGTAVGVQGTQNTGVTETDLTTTSISSGITTIAGGQTVSLQLMEQSPLNIDDIILGDLAAAYAVAYNTQVISGSGSGGNQTGILTLSGTNAVTYTNATPTAALLYSAIANATQLVHTNRFLPPDAIVMHPRRWAWLTAQSDSAGRPLVLQAAGSPMNTLASQGEVTSQGYAGTMQGLPVYVDAVLPTNLGAGTNQDVVLVARTADLVQWESSVRAEAFQQTYANQMSVFVRLYNYMSFQPARFPKSISVIGGTGLVAPTF
jgi:HK97 family phage major capsid protein